MSRIVYAPLHVHTENSFLDGASKIPASINRILEIGQTTLAITDHGVMHGAIELIKKCLAKGIKPIVGNEMYCIPHKDLKAPYKGKRYHLIVLAKNFQGYQNLCKLTTKSHLEGWQGGKGIFARPCINKEALAENKEGLIILSGCIGGEVPQAIINGDMDRARELALWFKQEFGEDYYIEIQDHGRRGKQGEKLGDNKQEDGKLISEAWLNRQLVDLAKELGIKWVATNDSHFVCGEDAEAHNTLVAINSNKKFADGYTGTEYLKTQDEMLSLFRDHLEPWEIRKAIVNTARVAQKVEIYDKDLFGHNRAPKYIFRGKYEKYKDLVPSEFLRRLSKSGLKKRFPNGIPKGYQERLDYELKVVIDAKFEEYFLVVFDYMNWALDNNIPTGAGRGSACGSLLAYALNITNVDPIHHGLLFERFLNPERKSMPDVDSDFCIERRGEVIKYCAETYGKDRVAQICTFTKLAPRAALKDVARVKYLPFTVSNNLTEYVPVKRGIVTSLKELVKNPELSPEFFNQYQNDSAIKEVVDIAIKLEDTKKTSGVHAAGVVISSEPLENLVPLMRDRKAEDAIITQYSMGDIEELGLLKMDFLGLRNLTIAKKTMDIINKPEVNQKYILGRDTSFNHWNLSNLPTDVRKSYDLILTSQLEGIFQLESDGMGHAAKELEPKSIDELSTILALYRPGILDAGLLETFIKRFKGEEEITYQHPKLEPILKRTFGIPVYQEQIMKMAQELAGYSLGRADLLRRAMGKKKPEEMAKQRMPFVEGCKANGIEEEKALEIFALMELYAAYSFNASHSIAYSYTTWLTLWLKANYPIEFISCLLSSVADDYDKIAKYYTSSSEQGYKFLPPNINLSRPEFYPEQGKIRFGLANIRDISWDAAKKIVANRPEGGYETLGHFCRTNPFLNKTSIASLINAGCFDYLGLSRDYLGLSRQHLLKEAEDCLKGAKRDNKAKDKKPTELVEKQLTLFDTEDFQGAFISNDKAKSSKTPEMPLGIRAEKEIKALGVCLGESPLGVWQKKLEGLYSKFADAKVGENMAFLVSVVENKTIVTRKKDFMSILTLTDGIKNINAVMFPDFFNRFNHILEDKGAIALVLGQVSDRQGNLQIVINYVHDVESLRIVKMYPTPDQRKPVWELMKTIKSGCNPTFVSDKPMPFKLWVNKLEPFVELGIRCEVLELANGEN